MPATDLRRERFAWLAAAMFHRRRVLLVLSDGEIVYGVPAALAPTIVRIDGRSIRLDAIGELRRGVAVHPGCA